MIGTFLNQNNYYEKPQTLFAMDYPIFITIPSYSIIAQCDITSFTANYVPNSCEGEIIMIEFDFVATDFGTNGFTVDSQE